MNVLHEILKVKMWLFLPEKQVGQVLPGPYRYEPVPIFQDKERQNGENDLSKNFDETGDAEQYKRDLYVDKKGIFQQRLYQIFNPTVTEGGLLKPPPTKNYHISTFLWSNWAKKIDFSLQKYVKMVLFGTKINFLGYFYPSNPSCA